MSRSDVTLSRMFIRRMMALAGMMTLLPAHEYLNHRPQSKSPKSTFVMFFVVSKTVLFFFGWHYVWHASHDFLVSNAFLCWWWPMTCLLCLARQRYAPPFAEVMLQCKCLMIFVTLQPLLSSELIALSILWSRLSGGLSMFLLSKSFECSTRFNSLFPGLGYGRTGAVWFSFRFSKQSHHNGIDLSVHTQGLHGFALVVLVHSSILLKTDSGGGCICLIFLFCCYSTEMFIFALCRLCQE